MGELTGLVTQFFFTDPTNSETAEMLNCLFGESSPAPDHSSTDSLSADSYADPPERPSKVI